jgi:hypothetical protein
VCALVGNTASAAAALYSAGTGERGKNLVMDRERLAVPDASSSHVPVTKSMEVRNSLHKISMHGMASVFVSRHDKCVTQPFSVACGYISTRCVDFASSNSPCPTICKANV